jgi:hypothetical protein
MHSVLNAADDHAADWRFRQADKRLTADAALSPSEVQALPLSVSIRRTLGTGAADKNAADLGGGSRL